MKRVVAVFDFDGTLTRKDTLIVFLRYVLGPRRFLYVLLKCSPWLLAYKLKLCSNWKAKQRLFSMCFKGMEYTRFVEYGISFAAAYPDLLQGYAMGALEKHLADGDDIYVVTASMEEWVRPLLAKYPSLRYIATIPECAEGRLTGRFASPNCYGEEKVRRLIQCEPLREEYELFMYGDSAGDKALLEIADKSYYRVLA